MRRLNRVPAELSADLLPIGRFPVRDWPSSDGTAVELPKVSKLRPPEFVRNLSDVDFTDWFRPRAEIHGSYLVSRPDVMLFGPNHLVNRNWSWSCETRTFKRQYMTLVASDSFGRMYPGMKPGIELEGDEIFLDCRRLRPCDIESIREPVFLATPLEPDNWGRWITTTVPKTVQFKTYGRGRKFLCRADHQWQRNFLRLLGIENLQLMGHDPGRTYFCRDAATIEYSAADTLVSDTEKQIYADLADACRRSTPDGFGDRIFVSRLSHSARYPRYRVLQNEPELIAALVDLGFKAVQPEQL